MTEEQAGTLIDRLVAAFDKQLKPDTAAVYLEFLVKQPFERTKVGVEKCIEKERFFPSVGTIKRYADESDYEGQPNAGAYRQDGGRKPWSQSDEAAYLFWRQQQIEACRFPVPLPEEEDPNNPDEEALERRYWAFARDPAYRRECEAIWRNRWRIRAVPA